MFQEHCAETVIQADTQAASEMLLNLSEGETDRQTVLAYASRLICASENRCDILDVAGVAEQGLSVIPA